MMPGEMGPFGTPGLGWRVSASILAGVGWLAFVIVWLFFFASGYDGYQNLAVIFASLLAVIAVLGGVWVGWGLKLAREATPGTEWSEYRGTVLRGAVTVVLFAAWSILMVIWLWSYAASFSIYQNLAVIIVSILIVGGISGAMWAAWGRHCC